MRLCLLSFVSLSFFFTYLPSGQAGVDAVFDWFRKSFVDKKVTEIPAGTEVYLLSFKEEKDTSQVRLYGLILDEKPESKAKFVWIPYDKNNPRVKLFTSDISSDRLAYPTDKLKKAFYAVLMDAHPVITDNKEEFYRVKKYFENKGMSWDYRMFRKLSEYVPITNLEVPLEAEDHRKSCVEHPQRKNGEPCYNQGNAFLLPKFIKSYLKEASGAAFRKYGRHVPPELIASVIHAETHFNPLQENDYEKNQCEAEACSVYGWGKGLAQLGKPEAEKYRLSWDEKFDIPKACMQKARSVKCYLALAKVCNKMAETGRPSVFCPRQAIYAVALKLASIVSDKQIVWVKEKNGSLSKKKIAPFLFATAELGIRSTVAAYNRRGARVFNSFVEYYEQNGEFPQEFGEAWAAHRRPGKTPSFNIGYSILNQEFINRCYVWNIAGICGELPKVSLVSQYRNLLQKRKVPKGRLRPQKF